MTPFEWITAFMPALDEEIPIKGIDRHGITTAYRDGHERVELLITWPGMDKSLIVELSAEDFAKPVAELALDVREEIEKKYGARPA